MNHWIIDSFTVYIDVHDALTVISSSTHFRFNGIVRIKYAKVGKASDHKQQLRSSCSLRCSWVTVEIDVWMNYANRSPLPCKLLLTHKVTPDLTVIMAPTHFVHFRRQQKWRTWIQHPVWRHHRHLVRTQTMYPRRLSHQTDLVGICEEFLVRVTLSDLTSHGI